MPELPLTYQECRTRFQRSAAVAGVAVTSWPITARGPHDERLSIDTVLLGEPSAGRMLVLMSGVHGVEGFVSSALQCDLLERLGGVAPRGTGILMIHSVNPWGMAWWRRQNESNVDLNRNWRRSDVEPVHNDAYDELHPLACPDTPGLPDSAEVMSAAFALVEERGLEWVRSGITRGQYRHPDGLHFGGERTEESTAVVERVVRDQVLGASRVFTIDLHTGHGPYGEVTALSDRPSGSPQDRFLRDVLGPSRVEPTVDNPEAATGEKSGQLASGIRDLLDGATAFATSVEFGTAPDEEQLVATLAEQWVHRRGDRSVPAHSEAVWNYRCCFTPDDAGWVESSLRHGREVLDAAIGAVAGWTDD